jgi:hypothetical protein
MGAFRVVSGILRARKRYGAIAQLGERLHGMQEVDGSIPSGSTNKINRLQLTTADHWQPGTAGASSTLAAGIASGQTDRTGT